MTTQKKIGITAATSHYGSATIRHLLNEGVRPDQIVALGRNRDKLDELAAHNQGIQTRTLDYAADTDTIAQALAGIDRLLFVPTAETSGRVEENERVIRAAEKAQVQDLLYVSFIGATEFPNDPLTPDHAATEALLDTSPLNTLSARSGFYSDNTLRSAHDFATGGVFPSTAQDGKISAVSREDLAEAAAKVLASDTIPTGVQTWAGPALTKREMAAALSDAHATTITYLELDPEAYTQGMVDSGMPLPVAEMFTQVDIATRDGALYSEDTSLEQILGRKPTSFAEAARANAQQ